jgi:hypothetical protein
MALMPRELLLRGLFLWAMSNVRRSIMLKKAEKKTAKAAGDAPTRKATSTARRKAKPPVSYEMIEVRAYEIFESGSDGSDLDNWLLAESELQDDA